MYAPCPAARRGGSDISFTRGSITNKDGIRTILKVTPPGLAVKDAKTAITCTVTLTDDTVITVTDSLAGYMARSTSDRDKAVVEALMRYVESAVALANSLQAG